MKRSKKQQDALNDMMECLLIREGTPFLYFKL
jgi:hypothetical protein